jgi:hypothetical protein
MHNQRAFVPPKSTFEYVEAPAFVLIIADYRMAGSGTSVNCAGAGGPAQRCYINGNKIKC